MTVATATTAEQEEAATMQAAMLVLAQHPALCEEPLVFCALLRASRQLAAAVAGACGARLTVVQPHSVSRQTCRRQLTCLLAFLRRHGRLVRALSVDGTLGCSDSELEEDVAALAGALRLGGPLRLASLRCRHACGPLLGALPAATLTSLSLGSLETCGWGDDGGSNAGGAGSTATSSGVAAAAAADDDLGRLVGLRELQVEHLHHPLPPHAALLQAASLRFAGAVARLTALQRLEAPLALAALGGPGAPLLPCGLRSLVLCDRGGAARVDGGVRRGYALRLGHLRALTQLEVAVLPSPPAFEPPPALAELTVSLLNGGGDGNGGSSLLLPWAAATLTRLVVHNAALPAAALRRLGEGLRALRHAELSLYNHEPSHPYGFARATPDGLPALAHALRALAIHGHYYLPPQAARCVGRLSELTRLTLQGAAFAPAAPADLASALRGLRALRAVELGTVRFADGAGDSRTPAGMRALAAALAALPALHTLGLTYMEFGPPALAELSAATALTRVTVAFELDFDVGVLRAWHAAPALRASLREVILCECGPEHGPAMLLIGRLRKVGLRALDDDDGGGGGDEAA